MFIRWSRSTKPVSVTDTKSLENDDRNTPQTDDPLFDPIGRSGRRIIKPAGLTFWYRASNTYTHSTDVLRGEHRTACNDRYPFNFSCSPNTWTLSFVTCLTDYRPSPTTQLKRKTTSDQFCTTVRTWNNSQKQSVNSCQFRQLRDWESQRQLSLFHSNACIFSAIYDSDSQINSVLRLFCKHDSPKLQPWDTLLRRVWGEGKILGSLDG